MTFSLRFLVRSHLLPVNLPIYKIIGVSLDSPKKIERHATTVSTKLGKCSFYVVALQYFARAVLCGLHKVCSHIMARKSNACRVVSHTCTHCGPISKIVLSITLLFGASYMTLRPSWLEPHGLRTFKGEQIFRVALGIAEYNEHRWIINVVNDGIIVHFRHSTIH